MNKSDKVMKWIEKHPAVSVVFVLIVLIIFVSIPSEPNYSTNEISTPTIEDSSNEVIEETDNVEDNKHIVTRIIDGDTFEIDTGQKVRLICIDTPETYEEGYQEASDFLEERLLGQEVLLIKDISETDRYGRLLR